MSESIMHDVNKFIREYKDKKAPSGAYYTFYFGGGYIDCKQFESNQFIDGYITLRDSRGKQIGSIATLRVTSVYFSVKKYITECLYRVEV